MIKDVFKLRRKSWHAKLMKWIWGYNPDDFRNMCPYFWLTILNVLIAIPFSIIKLIVVGVLRFALYVSNAFEEACREREERWDREFLESVKQGNKSAAWKMYDVTKRQHDPKYKVYSRFRRLERCLTNEDRAKYQALIEKIQQERAERQIAIRREEQAREERKRQKMLKKAQRRGNKPIKTRQQRIGEMTVKIKYAAKIVGAIALGFVAYLLYLGVVWMTTLDWNNIGGWALCIFLWGLFGFGAISAIYVLYSAIAGIGCVVFKYCTACDRRRERIRNFFKALGRNLKWTKYIGIPFAIIGIGLWRGLRYIWRKLVALYELCMAIKSNNCPGIDWE